MLITEPAAPLYEEIFGMRPDFDTPENIIAFDGRLANAPLPQANEHTAALALQHCRDLLDRRWVQGRDGITPVSRLRSRADFAE